MTDAFGESEPVVSFSGLTSKGLLFLARAKEQWMNEAEEYLSGYVDPEAIPEPARSFVLEAMVKLKLDSETEGRHQGVKSLRVRYLQDPVNNQHYRRVLLDSYSHALCFLCDKEPTHFEAAPKGPNDPDSACEDHVSFLNQAGEYRGKRKYGDTYDD